METPGKVGRKSSGTQNSSGGKRGKSAFKSGKSGKDNVENKQAGTRLNPDHLTTSSQQHGGPRRASFECLRMSSAFVQKLEKQGEQETFVL